MLLGMYTIIALAFVSLFLFFNPRTHFMPIGSYTNAINKVCISRRPKNKGFQSRFFLSGLGLVVAPECLSNECLWRAFLYIFLIEMIIFYLDVSRSAYSISLRGMRFLIFNLPRRSLSIPSQSLHHQFHFLPPIASLPNGTLTLPNRQEITYRNPKQRNTHTHTHISSSHYTHSHLPPQKNNNHGPQTLDPLYSFFLFRKIC